MTGAVQRRLDRRAGRTRSKAVIDQLTEADSAGVRNATAIVFRCVPHFPAPPWRRINAGRARWQAKGRPESAVTLIQTLSGEHRLRVLASELR